MLLFSPTRRVFAFVVIGLLEALLAAAERTLNIINACPQSITVYVNGESEGTMATGARVVKSVPDDWNGFVYTNVNGPSGNTGAGTTKAGFVNQAGYYFIAKDASNFNTGVSIIPSASSSNGLCKRVTCDSQFCSNSFTGQPSEFPTPSSNAPAPPLFSCSASKSFDIRFCPGGNFPQKDGTVLLHPKGNSAKCLEARDGVAGNGTAVQIFDCNGRPSQRWKLAPGVTQVELAGTGFCLDGGSAPANRNSMKIWKCIKNLRAQTWTYNARSQLTLGSTGQCLDVTLGSTANRNIVQTFQCSNGNSNQVFTVT